MRRRVCPSLVLAVALAGPAAAIAQAPPLPCAERPGYGTLDFWLGEWDVLLPDGTRAGTNRIEKVLGGCAVKETWTDARGYEGWSLFYVVPATGEWRQVWVTQGGGVKEKILVPHEGGVRFQGRIPQADGSHVDDRTTLTADATGGVRQVIEQSRDGGRTWTVIFDGRYSRR